MPNNDSALTLPSCTATASAGTVTIRAVGDITAEDWSTAVALIGLSPGDTDFTWDFTITEDDANVYTITKEQARG